MPTTTTPLETYLNKTKGLSQLPNEFAIGTDNEHAKNLLLGIQKFREAIPHTLSWHLTQTEKKWTLENNLAWYTKWSTM